MCSCQPTCLLLLSYFARVCCCCCCFYYLSIALRLRLRLKLAEQMAARVAVAVASLLHNSKTRVATYNTSAQQQQQSAVAAVSDFVGKHACTTHVNVTKWINSVYSTHIQTYIHILYILYVCVCTHSSLRSCIVVHTHVFTATCIV